jgi:hypothetical protein
MLGSQPCKAKGWEGSVEILTFTGIDKNKIICNVGNPDIKHFVQVRSLRTYETRIKCTGQITSKPRFIKFESPDTSVTEDEWKAECTLSNNKKHTFSHVIVSSKQLGTGDQIIQVTLEIDRLRGIKERASLQITVSS